ncbi:primosomal protein N' [Solemya velum gill symbiont]|uniref:primosomal protein N' n=1 Tax=Solemya velum gill symbiont TaxID=2340 RepID=UPI00099692F5|nr:primosomal protein N' [Solemya velum gill symbiont]OOZ80165.1 primosomal protein N' [Solemya velum gill symbiont]
MRKRIVRVAVQAPLPGLFDYLFPAHMTAEPGCRVLVPFGRGKRVGIVWEFAEQKDDLPYKLKPVEQVIDDTALLDVPLRKLLEWSSNYYHHPIGDVVATALPVNLRQERSVRAHRQRYWALTPECPDVNELNARALRQIIVIQKLKEAGSAVAEAQLRELGADIGGVLKRLAQKGWIEESAHFDSASNENRQSKQALKLNDEQHDAVTAMVEADGKFAPILLQGVTGSGKTEVYIQAAQAVIGQGKQVLVLVPEIGLTPQLLRRFQAGIESVVVSMHSGMGDSERERAWNAARSGDARLLVGTRSAVFVPLPELGLIIIDEEHDLSYKQQEGFRYAARDVAVMRAKQLEIPVVLGSATPSLETIYNALQGRYQHLRLTQRAGGAVPPTLQAVDIRSEHLHGGLSATLIKAIRKRLQAGEQVILFLNRRGYAPQLTCNQCGWIAECEHCDARMTLHASAHRLWCHHCGYQKPQPKVCPACESEEIVYLGQGTERLEETLGELFAETPVVRLDRDTTRRKGSLEAHLEKMHKGESGILVGTQMVAKGHDFPNVTLVGILNLDAGLLSPDFRSPEKTAQLMLQVAGRAGRGEKSGHVIIQTRNPDHPLLQELLRGDYDSFAKAELKERHEVQFPPYSYQLLLRAESSSAEKTDNFLEYAADTARELLNNVEIWGPVPAPMERKAGHFRGHLLLQATERATLHAHIDSWSQRLRKLKTARSVRWSIDIDPQEQL